MRGGALIAATVNRGMFAGIAGRYDRLNQVLSLGLDRGWRRATARALDPVPEGCYLDLGTGTADLAIAVLRQAPQARVIGVDLALTMVQEGQRKLCRLGMEGRVRLVVADGLRLPLGAESMDGVCGAFVIRNVESRTGLFQELVRVLRGGARICLLELTRPRHPVLRVGHGIYLRTVVPAVGRLCGRAAAYGYLAESVRRFAEREVVMGELVQAGFGEVSAKSLSGGVVTLLQGRLPV